MTNKSSGLGRGLSSLIPVKSAASLGGGEDIVAAISGQEEKIRRLPVDQIVPHPSQPRQDFNEVELRELADSLKEQGLIQPIIVAPLGDKWQIIAGERRWRAAKLLGWATIEAIVREFSEQKKLEVALIENLQRRDLNAIETALAYQALISQFNLSHEELGRRLGKSKSAISNTIRILNAPEEIKAAIIRGEVSEGHVRNIVGLPKEDQMPMFSRIKEKKMSVREVERAAREIIASKGTRRLNFYPEAAAKEKELAQHLNTKVEIKKFGGAGQIIVRFFSDEEFYSLVDKLLGKRRD